MKGKYASIVKITRPRITGILPRKRLFCLLDSCRKYPVIWITGPAGSGKTALVSSYLDARKLRCLWYQVDEGDSDIATFFSYMGMAAKEAAPRKRTPLPLLTPEYLQGTSTFTLRYFENLFSRFKIPYVLVFDNYHVVPADSNFHSMLSDGLSTIPEGMNVIISSRHDLPPALSRLHANGLMGILGWDELRLSLEESGGIVRLRKKGKTPREMTRRLHEASDGWAAGLVLMLESLKRGIESHLLGELTPKEIVDYFGNELFNKTGKEMQDFLLKTVFLPRTTAKMAEELTGLPNAGKILSTLNRNNSFTQKHYSAESSYQYHPLFREFLMARAKETFSHEALSTLLYRATLVLEEAGQTKDAISLLRDLGDWDAMIRLIMKQAPSMLEQGRYRPLEEWLDSLPKEMLENDPWLLYWKGASRFPFNPFQAQSYFKEAFEQFKIQNNSVGTLLAWSGVVDSITYTMEDFSLLDRWTQIFPELPENPEKVIPPEVWIRVVSSAVNALASSRRLEHSESEAWIRRAASIVQGPASSLDKAQILFSMVNWHVAIGDFEQSSVAIQSLRQLAETKEPLSVVLMLTRAAEAIYYQWTGDHEKCLKAVSEGLKTSESTGISSMDSIFIGHAILSYQNVGDLEMAQTVLEKMVSSRNRYTEKLLYYICQTRQFLLRSELAAASIQAESALKTATDIGSYVALCLIHLLVSQVMYGVGRRMEAWSHLHEAFSVAERLNSKVFEYYGLMIEAYFHFEQRDEFSGLTSLRKALTIGKGKGFFNTYVDQPAVTLNLCIKALEEGIEVPYVQDIIRKRRLVPENPPLHLENWPWSLKIYTLGKFELLKDEKPLQFSRKVQKKPLLMLKALIARGGKDVKEQQLSDMLWPEADGDAARKSFKVTLYRLRRLLGKETAFKLQERNVILDPRYCWVDSWTFERIYGQVETFWKESADSTLDGRQPKDNIAEAIRLTDKVMGTYKGYFLPMEEELWTISYRERLRNKFIDVIVRLGNYFQYTEEWQKAVECYQRALEVDDLAEEVYQHLMLCYGRFGQVAKAIAVYRRLKRTLSSALGIEPSSKTEAIYREMTGKIKIRNPT